MKTVPEMLRESAATYEERNALYGDNYKEGFGKIMCGLFPNGVTLSTEQDWNRIGCLVPVVSKLTRAVLNWSEGGHDDSLLDITVYTSMLRELEQTARVKALAARFTPPAVAPAKAPGLGYDYKASTPDPLDDCPF